MEKALFGAGCFWGVEDFFLQVPGVTDAVSGYAGGTTANPTYKQVCGGDTDHAEVVEVTFDPAKVSLRATLVDLFFKNAQPHPAEPPGSGFRHPVPLGDLHPWAGAGADRAARGWKRSKPRPLQEPDRHPDRARPRLLARRGLSSALFPEAWRYLPCELCGASKRGSGR